MTKRPTKPLSQKEMDEQFGIKKRKCPKCNKLARFRSYKDGGFMFVHSAQINRVIPAAPYIEINKSCLVSEVTP